MTKKDSPNPLNLRFVFRAVAILSLLLVYIFQWAQMMASPQLRTGADFMAFYAAGRVAQDSGVANAYKINLQQNVQEGVVGFPLAEKQVLLYNHIPWLIPTLALAVTENYVASFARWALLMLVIHIGASFLLARAVQAESEKKPPLVFFAGVALFFPFFQSLLLGQDTAILFFGVVLWSVGILRKNDWLAAVGLALTSVRPHLCLTLAIPLLIRRPSLGWKFLLTAGIPALASVLMLGQEGTLDFLKILQISADGTWHGMNENSMVNLVGLLMRFFPLWDVKTIHILGWVGYAAGIALLTLLWLRGGDNDRLISLSIAFALFFAPHLHYHDLTLLVVPLAALNRQGKFFQELPLAVSGLMLALKPLYYVLPYLLFAALLWQAFNAPDVSGNEP